MRPFPRASRNLALALLLTVAGCNSLANSRMFGEGGPRPMIRIEVTNLNFNDATLHAIRDGGRLRLGIVTGKGTAVYTLAWQIAVPLRIEIDVLAGGRCTTE